MTVNCISLIVFSLSPNQPASIWVCSNVNGNKQIYFLSRHTDSALTSLLSFSCTRTHTPCMSFMCHFLRENPVSRCASDVTSTFEFISFSRRKRRAKQNLEQISPIKTSNKTKQEMQTKIKREKLIRAGGFSWTDFRNGEMRKSTMGKEDGWKKGGGWVVRWRSECLFS